MDIVPNNPKYFVSTTQLSSQYIIFTFSLLLFTLVQWKNYNRSPVLQHCTTYKGLIEQPPNAVHQPCYLHPLPSLQWPHPTITTQLSSKVFTSLNTIEARRVNCNLHLSICIIYIFEILLPYLSYLIFSQSQPPISILYCAATTHFSPFHLTHLLPKFFFPIYIDSFSF